jgi:dephospho-CoA kinase
MYITQGKNAKKVVVVFGGISSGKSSFCRDLISHDHHGKLDYVSMDQFVHYCYDDPDTQQFLINHFHTTDRKTISSMVFSSPALLDLLNSHFLPKVEAMFEEVVNQYSSQEGKTLILEFPLFLNCCQVSEKIRNLRDKIFTIRVFCNPQTQVERAQDRDKLPFEKITKIIETQNRHHLSRQEIQSLSDCEIDTTFGGWDVRFCNKGKMNVTKISPSFIISCYLGALGVIGIVGVALFAQMMA